jgi:outer membrane biosynthesis protein TonB
MPRLTTALAALALGVACALALASCGGSDAKLLPGDTAQEITENLDAVQQLAAEEQCVDAEDAALEVSTQIESLEGIDPKLKHNLEEGAERLNQVVDTCTEQATEETTEEEPETTETTEEEPDKKNKKPKQDEAETPAGKPEKKTPPPAEPPEPPGQEAETPSGTESESPSGGIGPGSEAGPEG